MPSKVTYKITNKIQLDRKSRVEQDIIPVTIQTRYSRSSATSKFGKDYLTAIAYTSEQTTSYKLRLLTLINILLALLQG